MIRRHVTFIGFFALYALSVFHRPLIGDAALFQHDVSIAYLPLRTAAAEAIRDGHLPLWESRMGNGFPVLAEGQAGVFYPPHVLGYLGIPQYRVYAILAALHCVLAAWFMALFCGLWVKRLMPCLVAGLIYGFSGFFITHVMQITLIEAPAWLPLCLFCIERWLRDRRALGWLVGAAITLAVQELVAMPQMFLYSVLTVLLYMIVAALGRAPSAGDEGRRESPGLRRRVGGAGMIAAATAAILIGAVLLAMVQIRPTSGLRDESSRHSVTAETLRELSLAPRNLAYFVHPYILGSYAEGNYFGRDHYYEVCGFAGTIALFFGLLGALHGRGRGRVFAVALVPVALFMALANQNPLYELFPSIPGLSFFRGAGRYVLLSSLGLGLLAAIGLEAVGDRRRAMRSAFALGLLGTLLVIAAPLALRAGHDHVAPKLQSLIADPSATPELLRAKAEEKYEFFVSRLGPGDAHFVLLFLCLAASTLVCGVGLVRATDVRWLEGIALALTLAQLFAFAARQNPTIDPDYYETQPRLAAHLDVARGECLYMDDQTRLEESLEGDRGWVGGDMSFYRREREMVRPNRQVIYGLRSASVFYALVVERYWVLNRLLCSSLSGERDPKTGLIAKNPLAILSAMGVRLICTTGRDAFAGLPVVEEFETWEARRNHDPAPQAYFADGIVPCFTPEAALGRMCAPGFDFRKPVVEVPGEHALMTSPGERKPEILSLQNDHGHVTVRCRVDGRAFLVVREVFDPHFRCLIDGEPTRIFRTNYIFRGVEVGPGEHRVEFVYDAADLRLGMIISGATLLGMLLMLVAGRWRRGSGK